VIEPDLYTTSIIDGSEKPPPSTEDVQNIPQNSQHDGDESGEGANSGEGASSGERYCHLSQSTAYSVLSLRRNPENCSSIILDCPDYDEMAINHGNPHLQEMERTQSEDEANRQSLINETVREYLLVSQIMNEKSSTVTVSTDKETCKLKARSMSLPPQNVSHQEVLPTRSWSVTKGH
jgi:hypothetical protein